jgi:hypothetical protein
MGTKIWCIVQFWCRFCLGRLYCATSSPSSTTEVCPTSSDPDVLGLVYIWCSVGNLSFLRTIVSFVTYVPPVSNCHGSPCDPCRFRIVPFFDNLRVTVRAWYLWWDVSFERNFGSVTPMFSAAPFLIVQLENSGVMLSKFCSDPVTHHK